MPTTVFRMMPESDPMTMSHPHCAVPEGSWRVDLAYLQICLLRVQSYAEPRARARFTWRFLQVTIYRLRHAWNHSFRCRPGHYSREQASARLSHKLHRPAINGIWRDSDSDYSHCIVYVLYRHAPLPQLHYSAKARMG